MSPPATNRRAISRRVYEGAIEVGGAIVTAVSNTIVSFIPVFSLTDQEGKLFRPLAFTKTFAIGGSVILAHHPRAGDVLLPVPAGEVVEARRVVAGRRARASRASFATHAVLMWTDERLGHYSGWPTAIAVGVIVALAVVRMARERFLPLEENVVSRGVSRVYEPTLRWILATRRRFSSCRSRFCSRDHDLARHRHDADAGGLAHQSVRPRAGFAGAEAGDVSQADRRRDAPARRVRSAALAAVHRADGSTHRRILWRRQDPKERDAEVGAGIKSSRSDASCRASAASSCRRWTKARSSTCRRCCRSRPRPGHRSQRHAGPRHRERAGSRERRRQARPRRIRARSRAHRHDGDHHHPQAGGRVAARAREALVLRLARVVENAARLDFGRSSAASRRAKSSPSCRRRRRSPACCRPGCSRSRRASSCCRPASAP